VKKNCYLQLLLILCFSSPSIAQLDELTPSEARYRDSIKSLNLQNEAIAKSQESYNKGIELFGQKKYDQAIVSFSESIKYDANFTAAAVKFASYLIDSENETMA
jgi:hypothetical protein